MSDTKEKAKKLVDECKYLYNDDGTLYLHASLNIAKKYALIVVDEVLKTNSDESIYGNAFSKYWYDVRQEIEKL